MGSILSIDYAPRTSFAEAATEAGIGYDDPSLLRGDVAITDAAESWPCTQRSSYLLNQDEHMGSSMAAWGTIMMRSSRLRISPIRVVDFGGAEGGHGLIVRDLFRLPVEWHIIETALHVQHGRRNIRDRCLSFHISMD